MSVASQLLQRLLWLILPATCLGCQRTGPWGALELGLCISCRGKLRPVAASSCPGCLRPLEMSSLPSGYRCGACRAHPPRYARVLAGWHYDPPLDQVIRALKFGRLEYLAAHLGRALLRELGSQLGDAQLVAPVPLHWRRRLTRGYDQADRIAATIARGLGLPLLHPLRRTRSTAAQTRLDRSERQRNVRGAFGLRTTSRWRDQRILLVDDVFTTGATLREAAARLRRGGAASVMALVAAAALAPADERTPLPRRSGLFDRAIGPF